MYSSNNGGKFHCSKFMQAADKKLINEFGPYKDQINILGRPDTATLCNELVSVSDWRTLGLNLGVQHYELDQIETSHPTGGCGRWKQETFSLWLRRTPRASWRDVIRALRRMEENTVAETIEQKHSGGPEHASKLTRCT